MMRIRRWQLWGIPLVALGLALAACGEGSAGADPSAGEVRPLVSNFAVSTGQDTAFTLSEHAGDVVVLYFSFPG